jgi:hypothetical protein
VILKTRRLIETLSFRYLTAALDVVNHFVSLTTIDSSDE